MQLPELGHLKKAVELVHCSGNLSLLERKLFNLCVLQSYDDLLVVGKTHSIPMQTLLGLMGMRTRNYEAIRDAFKELQTKPVTVNLLAREEKKAKASRTRGFNYEIVGLMSYARVSDGMVEWRFDEAMARLLHDPQIYARINLGVQKEFASSFSLNLHESLSRYLNIGTTGWWTIAQYRELVGATAPTYDNFPKLRVRAIESAVREINRVSDLHTAYELSRSSGRGKSVQGIRFLIKPNPQYKLFRVGAPGAPIDHPLVTKLKAIGCSSAVAQQLMGWGEAAAQATYDKVIEGLAAQKIRNPGAYLAALYRENARPVMPTAEPLQVPADATVRGEDRGEMMALLADQRRAKALSQLTVETRRLKVAEFLGHDDHRAAVSRYVRNGDVHGIGEILFGGWLANQIYGPITEQELGEFVRSRRA